MNWIDVIEVIVVILCAVTYGLMLYFKVKGNLAEGVSELIALAEKTDLKGSEKMAQVVNAMYDKVPAWLKKFLNKYELEKIAQWVFDWMRKYADTYKSVSETQGCTSTEAKEIADVETVSALVVELTDKTLAELKSKASEFGIPEDAYKSKEDFIKAIVNAVMNKV